MNRTPRIIAASIGFLVAALTVDATNAGNALAQTVKSQLVQVVNTADQPIPVAGKIGIDAAQNTIKVDNSVPLNMRDLNSRITPWERTFDVFIPNGQGNKTQDYPVTLPAGKRLLVNEVSVRATLLKNDDGSGAKSANGYLGTASSDSNGDHQILMTPAMEYWNSRTFLATQEVHGYADSGRALRLFFERDNFKGEAMFRVTVSGQLIDAQ